MAPENPETHKRGLSDDEDTASTNSKRQQPRQKKQKTSSTDDEAQQSKDSLSNNPVEQNEPSVQTVENPTENKAAADHVELGATSIARPQTSSNLRSSHRSSHEAISGTNLEGGSASNAATMESSSPGPSDHATTEFAVMLDAVESSPMPPIDSMNGSASAGWVPDQSIQSEALTQIDEDPEHHASVPVEVSTRNHEAAPANEPTDQDYDSWSTTPDVGDVDATTPEPSIAHDIDGESIDSEESPQMTGVPLPSATRPNAATNSVGAEHPEIILEDNIISKRTAAVQRVIDQYDASVAR